ncbi:hypothetical protein TSPI_06976 [Trichinella spiralis]|uniref:Uncharacterized protein n=1 Tax=Trichinella spiralis TaxID=6334 RepID=A0ABR3KE88_TRISP
MENSSCKHLKSYLEKKQHFIDIGNLAMTVAMKIADLEELPKIFASPFTRRFVYFFCSSKTADMTMDKKMD